MNEKQVKSSSLDLPQGIDMDKLLKAVRASGYPLQTVVARQLNESFNVVEEWGFVDRTSKEHRSLDVFARQQLTAKSSRLEPALTLLVECKRSELPYVFFAAAIPQIPLEFPSIIGFPRSFFLYQGSEQYRDMSATMFLRCSDFPFVMDGPVIAATFSRIERKGKDFCLSGTVPYNNVILPLASAFEHFRDTWSGVSIQQHCFYPQITVCVCVIDAPLIIASGTPESPELKATSWVRLVHEEAFKEGHWWRRKHYYVDVVRRQFLATYIDDHLVPFAEGVATRMVERQDLVVAGKGMVADFEKWTWDEIQIVSS